MFGLSCSHDGENKGCFPLKGRFVGNLSIRPPITERDKDPYVKVYFDSVSDRILYVSSADSEKTAKRAQTLQV